MESFKREQRYVVVKTKDIDEAGCTQVERDAFNILCDKVAAHRISAGKGLLECVVVEKTWPEYEPAWAAIQRRVEGLELPALGSPLAGGFFGGEITVDGQRFALIVAPKAEGEKLNLEYKLEDLRTADGTDSDDDGLTNTARINDDNHPAAQFCRRLQIGGFDNWYLPSRDELMMLWRNLGPRRKKTPDLFKAGAAEAFDTTWCWSSTEHAQDSFYAWLVGFTNGYQSDCSKGSYEGVRAVRRLKL